MPPLHPPPSQQPPLSFRAIVPPRTGLIFKAQQKSPEAPNKWLLKGWLTRALRGGGAQTRGTPPHRFTSFKLEENMSLDEWEG